MKTSSKQPARSAESAATGRAAAPVEVEAPPEPGRRVLLLTVVGLALFWSLALLLMDLSTANPAVISRDQLQKADAVVVARPAREGGDVATVERVLLGEIEVGDKLTIFDLHEALPPDADEAWIIPLSRFGRDWRVTTLEGQAARPLIYSPTPQTLEQVKDLIRNRRGP